MPAPEQRKKAKRRRREMIKNAHRIAALVYLLWGLVHVVGGAAMLNACSAGPENFLRMLSGDQTAVLADAASTRSVWGFLAANEVFAFHSFNIIWLGLIACVVAIRMNWKNSVAGFWLNLAIVGFADLGLIVFMVVPGVMHLSDALIGPILFVVATVFSMLGRILAPQM
jgi:hypothetical protein